MQRPLNPPSPLILSQPGLSTLWMGLGFRYYTYHVTKDDIAPRER